MTQLRHHAHAFPIEDIGVAQGNSLSPLLGNIYLADFDKALNSYADIRCIRYIDDILILARSRSAANNQFSKAKVTLQKLGLTLSEDKTVFSDAKTGFVFLGIEIINGLIRPSKEKREEIVASVGKLLDESRTSFSALKNSQPFDSKFNLLNTLFRVRALLQGWGKHYWFCNDFNCIDILDKEIDLQIDCYRSDYAKALIGMDIARRRSSLGIEGLGQLDRSRHFVWPKMNAASTNP
jgi:RNA-directed DNA polymerase